MKNTIFKKNIIAVPLICLALLTYWGTKSLVVTEYNITSNKIPEKFSEFRITQITDLHNATFGKNNVTLINEIKKTNPNIIVLTGDIIDSRNTDVDVAINFIEQAVEIAPTYYVTGNHEFRILKEYDEMEESMLRLGVNVLRNEESYIEIDGESIKIIGLDASMKSSSGFFYVPGVNNVEVAKILNEFKNNEIYSILLSHRPELFNLYVEGEIDLAFTGHTHGGQIRIPFLGGVIAPNQAGLFPKHDSGLFTENETNMIVSRGVGNSVIPIRIFNRPEIVVVQLN